MLDGIQCVARAVLSAYGPLGFNALLDRPDAPPIATSDGLTILNDIWFSKRRKLQLLGLDAVWEACSDTNEMVGDGTSTTLLYIYSMLIQANKLIVAGYDSTKIVKYLQELESEIFEMLYEAIRNDEIPYKEINTMEDMAEVANTSMRDKGISELLAEAVFKAGEDAIIQVEEDTVRGHTWIDYIDASIVPSGMYDFKMANDKTLQRWVAEKPLVYTNTDQIHSIDKLLPALELALKEKRPILLVCGNFSDQVVETILNNRIHGLNACLIRGPATTNEQVESISDISVLTGAKLFGSHTKNPVHDLAGLQDLGVLESATVEKERSVLKPTDETFDEVCDLLDSIDYDIANIGDSYVIERLQVRKAILAGSVVKIYVGAENDMELSRLKGAVEDGVFSLQSAGRSGVVPGACFTQLYLSRMLKTKQYPDDKEIVKHIIINTLDKQVDYLFGFSQNIPTLKHFLTTIPYKYVEGYLLDISKGDFVPADDFTVVESLEYFRACFVNALSTVRALISSECAITINPPLDGKTDMDRADDYWRATDHKYEG